MAAKPYVRLFTTDLVADTAHLTDEEFGIYMRMLIMYYQTGKPLIESRIARMLRLGDGKWDEIRDTMSEFFQVDGEVWRQKRCDEELTYTESKSSKARRAAQISAKKRASQVPDKSDKLSERSANAQAEVKRTLSHTDTNTEKIQNNNKQNSGVLHCQANENNSHLPLNDEKITADLGERFTADEDDDTPPAGLDIETKTQTPPINGRRYDLPQNREYTDQEVVDLYHEHCPSLLPIHKITLELARSIDAAHNDPSKIRLRTPKHWKHFFRHVERSDFLTGRKGKARFSLRDILKPEMHAKIAEGKYDD